LRESIPLSIVLQNKLRYALYAREVKMILKDKDANVKVDGKVRRDPGFPTGIMGKALILSLDVISIEKAKENYRVLYDVSGRFILKSIKADEAKFKLVKVT